MAFCVVCRHRFWIYHYQLYNIIKSNGFVNTQRKYVHLKVQLYLSGLNLDIQLGEPQTKRRLTTLITVCHEFEAVLHDSLIIGIGFIRYCLRSSLIYDLL